MTRPRFLRRARAQAAGAVQLVKAAAKDPAMRRGLVDTVLRREVEPAPSGDRQLPEGLAEFSRTAHATVELDADVETVAAFIADPAQFPSWLTMHAGWRGDVPGQPEVGDSYVQQVRVMGIPADIRWTVAAVGEQGYELRGKGPMGLTMGFWLSVTPNGAGSVLHFDAGMDGQPIQGPMGTSVVRSVNEALAESVAKLPAALAAAGPVVRRRPVEHRATGTMLDPATPVIVGVGQLVRREPSTADPATLAVRALRSAAADAGVEALLTTADAVYSVATASWRYADQAALVAAAVGATPTETVQSSPFGGDGAQLLINDAAEQIAKGHHQVVLLTGAEAGASLAAAQRRGERLDWPDQGGLTPSRVVGIDKTANNDAETEVGLGAPIFMYPLMESALRGATGATPEKHQKLIGELWAAFSEVAAENPFAWSPVAYEADDLAIPSPTNRMVSAPYPKLLCANLEVDLATGIIMCSAAAAEAAGIAQEKWVFVHAGASAHDEWFVSNRADLAASPAIHSVGEAARPMPGWASTT